MKKPIEVVLIKHYVMPLRMGLVQLIRMFIENKPFGTDVFIPEGVKVTVTITVEE